MTLDTSYQDSYPFLFAGNAGTLALSDAGAGSSIDVLASLGVRDRLTFIYPWSMSFTLKADSSGKVSLDLKALLQSIEDILPDYDATESDAHKRNASNKPFAIKFTKTDDSSTVSFSKNVYRGRIPDSILSSICSGYQPLTVRPQVYVTREDASENLTVLNTDGLSGRVCKVKIYFGDGTSAIFTIASDTGSGTKFTTDISYSVVRALASGSYSSRKILAYDVWTVLGDTVTGRTMRYVVDRGRADAFRFRGSFGMLENIWARGVRKSELESETATIVNSEVERELTNDSKIVRETFTGYLKSAEEVRFWQEFFASAERYAVIDGNELRIVIDEIDTLATEGELSAFSFKWHYADRNDDPARVPARGNLTEYNSDVLWYETEAENESGGTSGNSGGLQGVKVISGSGTYSLPVDEAGYASLTLDSSLSHDGDKADVVWTD